MYLSICVFMELLVELLFLLNYFFCAQYDIPFMWLVSVKEIMIWLERATGYASASSKIHHITFTWPVAYQ